MKAAILSVGTELLFGQIVNTNTVYLSRQLNSLGIDTMYHYTVGDNPERLADIIKLAFRDCDLILTTGGLGPTQDDMTKEIVCQVMDDELVMHDDILEEIRARMLSYKKVMTDNNIKQALLPSRAVVFHNDAGTAPGFALENKEGTKCIACMPGPPKEMTRMFERTVRPWLEGKSGNVIFYREVRTFGIGESDLETALLPVIDGQTDPTIATYAKSGESSLRITSKRKTREEAEAAVNGMIEQVKELVGDYVYSCDGEELVDVVGSKLMAKGLTISAAESCTGGLFAATLTNVPGISQCFDRSLVTYSNQAKIDELGVKPETLEQHGAVSEETALEMAEGVRRVSGSDIGISVTGIAGPGGGTAEKPVGLVYVGYADAQGSFCKKIDRRLKDRDRNRRNAMLTMLDMINHRI